ncbi:MAG: glycosyltransferase [Flavobacteriia bacterium]|nr:glycosyltransferase [Flavobacteriia bacterium]
MRIFHGLVNYGTQAGMIAKGLREIGVKAKSHTTFDAYKRQTDFMFADSRKPLNKLLYYRVLYPILKIFWFFSYDTFHFYYGTSLWKNQKDLPYYKRFGKKVVMHYLGYDVEEYEWSVKNYSITNLSQSFTQDEGRIHDDKIRERRKYEAQFLNAEIVCSPQYAPFVPNAQLIPLAIDVDMFKFHPIEHIPEDEPLRLIHVPTSRKKKGTDYLIEAVEELQKEGVQIELDVCEGVTHAELLSRYLQAHVSVVALLGGWYGTAGIESMAMGRPIVTFMRETLFEYSQLSSDDIPIINANRDTIKSVLNDLCNNKQQLVKLSHEARAYVEQEHHYLKLAERCKSIYESL